LHRAERDYLTPAPPPFSSTKSSPRPLKLPENRKQLILQNWVRFAKVSQPGS
jgi:hypothetical protein